MSLIQSLLNPKAYPHPVNSIELIETHISWVLLTGQYAYKIKKPLQFDFLDFSTLEKRHFYCAEELRLNRRLAPDLYLQVVPITRTFAQPHVKGEGEIIEYAVQMRQFASQQLLSEIAQQGRLDSQTIDQLADLTADFHSCTQVDTSASRYGTAAEIQHWFLGNFQQICPLLEKGKFLQQILSLKNWGERELLKNHTLMQQRKQQGFIRECHGDLHLGNIAWFESRLTPFDGIEFNPALRWIDIINEVAFVVMDLQQRDMKAFAYRFLNRYLSATGDYSGVSLLRYYLVYRALVRTKVALLRWQQHQNPVDFAEAESYANLAESFTTPKPPLLLMTHGYSGSGKSTFGAAISETLGMIHLRSDVERQRLFSASQQARYTPETTQQTYQKLHEFAATLLKAGFSVLADATFLKTQQRALFQQLAVEIGVRFFILDFCTAETELKQRIMQRLQVGQDVSEATLAVQEHQLQTAQPLTEAEQKKLIRIDSSAENALEKLLNQLRVLFDA